MIALLPLLLATSAVTDGPARPAVRIATASVTIVQAERITPASMDDTKSRLDRQVRKREQEMLVEFY